MSYFRYGKSIPEFVRRFREEQGMSQTELGECMGYTRQYVSNVESGRYPAPMKFCLALMGQVEKARVSVLQDLINDAAFKRVIGRTSGETSVRAR